MIDQRSVAGRGKHKKALLIAAVCAIFGYTLARPWLNDHYGWNLPSLFAEQDQTEREQTQEGAVPSKEGMGELVPGQTDWASPRADDANRTIRQADEASVETSKYGILREFRTNHYVSPAGVQYVPGSAQGHRLKHLARHLNDQPDRPGSHGVFDDDMEGVLHLIDQAYTLALQNGSQVKQETDANRTIYTVSLGRRIGFVGGREGNRRGQPNARRIRLVLEGQRLITAFPL